VVAQPNRYPAHPLRLSSAVVRIADIHHHHEADYLGRAVEITEGIAHRRTLRNLTRRLKPIYSDNALVTDVEAPLEEQIFDLPQRQRIADIHHHREADDLGRTVEISEGIAHRRRLRILARRLKPIYSDNALRRDTATSASPALLDAHGCAQRGGAQLHGYVQRGGARLHGYAQRSGAQLHGYAQRGGAQQHGGASEHPRQAIAVLLPVSLVQLWPAVKQVRRTSALRQQKTQL
jgi:hypothetical protein